MHGYPNLISWDDRIAAAFQPEPGTPRRTVLELTAAPAEVPQARSHVRRTVTSWEMPTLADTTELLASELLTNAIAESEGSLSASLAAISMRVTAGVRAVLIEVHDPSPRLPVRREAPDDAENGRGLPLVTMLSSGWGASPGPGHGKIVWCVAGQDQGSSRGRPLRSAGPAGGSPGRPFRQPGRVPGGPGIAPANALELPPRQSRLGR